MNIIGFYKDFRLVENNGSYFVVNRQKRSILFRGTEEECSELFVMLIANLIEQL